MSSENRHEDEEFSLEIDSAVDSFFSRYEENAPKVDLSSDELENDTVSKDEKAPDVETSSQGPEADTNSQEEGADETDDSSLDTVFEMLSKAETASETDEIPGTSDPETAVEALEDSVEEQKPGAEHSPEKKFDPNATHVFNSLTEAILTVDWDVNDASLKETREILEDIRAKFPVLEESGTNDIIDGMLRTLDAMAESPQSMPTSAIAQLEKAVPILRGIASGAELEDGYDKLIEDTIAGLQACIVESSARAAKDALPSEDSDDAASEIKTLEPMAVPPGISHVLKDHSEVVGKLTPRALRLADMYAAENGAENGQELFKKICGLLDLQTRAFQDAFSLDCGVVVFPIGKIDDLSGFLDFQLKAMGVCVRHARTLEKGFKKQPYRKRYQQSIYLLRIALEKQVEALSKAVGTDDSAALEADSTIPAPL